MKKIFLIFRNSALRNKLTMLLSFFAAALMSFIFWNSISSDDTVYDVDTISVGIADYDNSALSENLGKYLTDSLGMEIFSEDYDSLATRLIDKHISAIIEVPRGFEASAIDGKPEKLEITTLNDYENAAFIEVYMNSYMNGVSVIAQAAGGNAETFSEMLAAQKAPNTVTFDESNAQTDKRVKITDAYVLSVGFMLMMISGITVFISNQILIDRQLGTYNRMKCSSLKSSEYVVGVSLFGIVCCTAANLIFNLFAFAVGDEMPISLGMALGINELFMLFSVGLAVLFALLVSEQRALMTVGIGYATIGSMLGSAWFPVKEAGVIGGIAKIFPQYWLMNILRSAGAPDFNALPNICVLALSAVLVYLVSAVIFTRKNA